MNMAKVNGFHKGLPASGVAGAMPEAGKASCPPMAGARAGARGDQGIYHSPAPPLTSADIITLHGKPAVRKTTKTAHLSKRKETAQGINDEWIYFNPNYEEHYFFKDEQLISWKKIPYQYDL